MKVLGFYSFADLFNYLFYCKKIKSMKIVVLPAFVLSFITMINFVEKWVWSPAWLLVWFGVILVGDFVLSSTVSLVNKDPVHKGFRTDLALRFGIGLVAYPIVFSIAFNMPKAVAALFGNEIVDLTSSLDFSARAFFFYCLIINVLSVLKHMATLKMLPTSVINFLHKYIDIHKNLITDSVNKKNTSAYGNVHEKTKKDTGEGNNSNSM